MTPQELQTGFVELCALAPPRAAAPEDLPSQDDWFAKLSDTVARARRGRATGTDLIPAEFMQIAGRGYLQVLSQLACRAFASGVPLAWRGGRMVPVPKKAALPLGPENARGVLCSSSPGKAYAAVLRSEAVVTLPLAAGECQQGAMPHRSLDFASHAAKLFMRSAACEHTSAALLFADLKAAFYSVLPEYVLGFVLPPSRRAKVFHTLGLSSDALSALEDALAAGTSELEALGVDASLREAIADWHRHCHFEVAGVASIFQTHVGTRPGDPLADVVFVYAFSRFIRLLHTRLLEQGLAPQVPLAGRSIFPEAGAPLQDVGLGTPAFMDDFCVPVVAPAAEVLGRLAATAVIVAATASEFGLTLNFKAGKTEAIVSFAGPGTKEARRRFGLLEVSASGPSGRPVPMLPLPDGSVLRLVSEYRHLGVLVPASKASHLELAERARSANLSCAALRRCVFQRRQLPVQTRVAVAQACVTSRALYCAGTWDRLSRAQSRRITASVLRPSSVIAASVLGATSFPCQRPSHEASRWAVRVPPVSVQIAAARLRYAARLSCHAPSSLFALVQSSGGVEWRLALLEDLRAMHSTLHDKLCALPSPDRAPGQWEAFWTAHPVAWRTLISLFVQRSAASEPGPDGDLDTESESEEFLCIDCGVTFHTRAALVSHRTRRHGYRNPFALRVEGSACLHCGVDFRSRARLLAHLGKVRACGLVALEFPQLSVEALAAADAADAAALREALRAGRHPRSGLPPLAP